MNEKILTIDSPQPHDKNENPVFFQNLENLSGLESSECLSSEDFSN